MRIALLVGLITVTVWGCVLQGPFRFDDHLVPLADPASQSLNALGAHLTTTLRPLTKLSFALEAMGELADSAPARRAVSVAIHGWAAALLALLLAQLTGNPRIGIVALLWGVHPVHAEALLAVSGRSAALSGALVLGALLAQCHRRTLIAAALLLAAALAIAWIVSVPRYRALAEFSFLGRPWVDSVAQQVAAIPLGLLLYVRPDLLSPDHGAVLPDRFASAGFALGMACLGAAAFTSRVAWRRGAVALAVGLTLWIAAIVPTQTVVPKLDPLTERPLGLALAGLLLAAAGLSARLQ